MSKRDPNLNSYLKELKRYPPLTAEEEKELAEKAKKGNKKARERLILSNLRLVVSIAKEYQLRGLSLADVIAEGNLGLLRAVEGYDPSTGYRFSTYATWWIRQYIRRAITKSGRVLKRPSYLLAVLLQVTAYQDKEEGRTGRRPGLVEAGKKCFTTERERRRFFNALGVLTGQTEVSLDVIDAVGELAADESASRPDELAIGKLELEALQRALGSLSRREAEILRMRYGIDRDKPMTLQEIGKKYGITRERVRQIESTALRKLSGIFGVSQTPKRGRRRR